MQQIHKLVRDDVPEKIVSGGKSPLVRVLSDSELTVAVRTKIQETMHNLLTASRENEKVIPQTLAELYQELELLSTMHGVSSASVSKHTEQLTGYAEKYFLETIEEPDEIEE